MVDTKQLDLAFLECQRDIKPICANNKGNFGTYADYEQIMYYVRPAMLKHGLALKHRQEDTADAHWLRTILIHSASGQVDDKCLVRVVPDKPGQAGYGAALTYAMRNSVRCIFALVTTDVDNVDSGVHEEDVAPPSAPDKGDAISSDEFRMLHKVLEGYPADKSAKALSFYKIDKWSQLPKTAFQKVYQGIQSYHANMATAGKPSSHV